MYRKSCWVGLVVGVCAGLLSVGGGQALAAGPACGATITADTRLHADLTGCRENGLVIGASHVELDLNGHTIAGDGEATDCAEGATCDVGIVNDAGHGHVKVFDGTVRDFDVGVLARGVRENRLLDLTTANASVGVVVESSIGNEIALNAFSDGILGLVVSDTDRTAVTRNSVSGGRFFGLLLVASDRNRVEGNTLADGDQGIGVIEGSSHNLVRRNTVRHELGSAIDIGGGGTGNRVEHNRVVDNGDGILLAETAGNVVRRNLVTGTGTFGADTGGFGLLSDGADRNVFDGNIVTGGRGPAIFIATLDAPTPSEDNVVTRNVATSTASDGILVTSGAARTFVARNTAVGSADDGIQADAPSTTLRHNTANRNGDLGIEAVHGVIDAGGNRAFGNGNPVQCENVLCR